MATARSRKSEFENALGAGGTNLAQADDVFSKLDSNSDGSVSLDEMSKALKGAGGHHGGHHHAQAASGSGDASGSDSDSSSSSSSGGSTSTTTTGADGSLDHHRHLCRRLQDDDDGAGRFQLLKWIGRRQFAL